MLDIVSKLSIFGELTKETNLRRILVNLKLQMALISLSQTRSQISADLYLNALRFSNSRSKLMTSTSSLLQVCPLSRWTLTQWIELIILCSGSGHRPRCHSGMSQSCEAFLNVPGNHPFLHNSNINSDEHYPRIWAHISSGHILNSPAIPKTQSDQVHSCLKFFPTALKKKTSHMADTFSGQSLAFQSHFFSQVISFLKHNYTPTIRSTYAIYSAPSMPESVLVAYRAFTQAITSVWNRCILSTCQLPHVYVLTQQWCL